MEPEVKIAPASGKCRVLYGLTPAGKPVWCRNRATMRLPADGTAMCDRHAEAAMTTLCGRPTIIKRST